MGRRGRLELVEIISRLFTPQASEAITMLPAGKYEAALEWIRRKATSLFPDEPVVTLCMG